MYLVSWVLGLHNLTKVSQQLYKESMISPISQIKTEALRFVVVVQSLSCVQLFVTPQTAAHQASLSFTISQSLLKFMSIKSVMLSSHLILCHPLIILPSIFPSIRIFSNVSGLHTRWPVGASASSNENSGLISSRIDWFDHLAVQRTLKSLLQ